MNLTSTDVRCCTIDTCSCTECDLTRPSCQSLETQSLNQSICYGGSRCCDVTCSKTCYIQHCSGSGSKTICYSTSYCCEIDCAYGVSHETCSFRCGTCTDYFIYYIVNATGMIIRGVDQRCWFGDAACRMNYVSAYGSSFVCYYDKTNLNSVSLSPPSLNSGYKAGIAFVVICGLVSLVFMIFLCRQIYLYCLEYMINVDKTHICSFCYNTTNVNTSQDSILDINLTAQPQPHTESSVPQPHTEPSAPPPYTDEELYKPSIN